MDLVVELLLTAFFTLLLPVVFAIALSSLSAAPANSGGAADRIDEEERVEVDEIVLSSRSTEVTQASHDDVDDGTKPVADAEVLAEELEHEPRVFSGVVAVTGAHCDVQPKEEEEEDEIWGAKQAREEEQPFTSEEEYSRRGMASSAEKAAKEVRLSAAQLIEQNEDDGVEEMVRVLEMKKVGDEEEEEWEGIEQSEGAEQFRAASAFASGHAGVVALSKLSGDLQLRLYGLYKVATEGPCYEAQPSALWPSSRAKWLAWQKLGNMSPEVAMQGYITLLSENIPGWDKYGREIYIEEQGLNQKYGVHAHVGLPNRGTTGETHEI